ncbi:hypothetical protein ACFW1A_17805 [Kitasatospora sp. NPDC058965]|uniref:hypothetical protein n=1 Tax=Kitasatospora sp. NPDC058965 TaxID=3346682 RepID=UPI0036AB675A
MSDPAISQARLESVALTAFAHVIRHYGIRLGAPADRDDARRQLDLIDEAVRRTSAREISYRDDDGKLLRFEVTIMDALRLQRRHLAGYLLDHTVGSAVTRLEQAVDEMGQPNAAEASAVHGAIRDLTEAQILRQQEAEVNTAELERQIRIAELKASLADRRRDRWFTRETVAALVGAVLLLGFGTALTVLMFQKTQPSEIVSSAFLMILGFFFGQGSRGGSRKDES